MLAEGLRRAGVRGFPVSRLASTFKPSKSLSTMTMSTKSMSLLHSSQHHHPSLLTMPLLLRCGASNAAPRSSSSHHITTKIPVNLITSGVAPGYRRPWQVSHNRTNNYNNSSNDYDQDNDPNDDSFLLSKVQRMRHPIVTATLVSAAAIVVIVTLCLWWDAAEQRSAAATATSLYVRLIRSSLTGESQETVYQTQGARPDDPRLRLIFLINGAVYLATLFRPAIMAKHIVHYPLSGHVYTLFTSVFAHASFPHIFFNMLTLNYLLQTTLLHMTVPHVYALYLSAGVFSSWFSHVAMLARFRFLGIFPSPTLGASGAIYSLVAMFGLTFPYSLTTFPFMEDIFTCYAINMIRTMVAGEVIGCFIPSSPLNHFAHLGGAMAGYVGYSSKTWWKESVAEIRRNSQIR